MSEAIPDNPVKGLGKKVGPLPMYAYAVIIVGAAYGVYWWKNRVGVAQPENVTTDVGSGMSSAGPMPGTGSFSGSVSTSPSAGASSKTNAQWAKNTADSLIASGSNPGDVNNALSTYLNGGTLSDIYASIIATALRLYGNPPEGIVAVKAAPTAAVVPLKDRYVKYLSFNDDPTLYGVMADGKMVGITFSEYAALGFPPFQRIDATSGQLNKPAPVTNTMYVVKDGDTLASIASSFYGSADGSKISAANPGVAITTGSVLKVPVQ